jgi:hypothetical protein
VASARQQVLLTKGVPVPDGACLTFVFSVPGTKFPRTCGGACLEARRPCKCSRRSCQASRSQVHEVRFKFAEEASCAYHVGGVCEIGERVRTRGVSLTESGWSESSGFIPTTK